MLHCNNCGVELMQTENVCPLCGRNCAESNTISSSPCAYPTNTEKVPLGRKRSAITWLVLLIIPAICCFVIDYLGNGIIDWAPYVLGAEACVFTYAFLPEVFTKSRLTLCVLSDTAITGGFLYLIGLMAGEASWVLPFGLPVTCLSGSLLFSVIKTAKSAKIPVLIKSSIVLGLIGIYSGAFETLFDLFQNGSVNLQWSLIVMPLLLTISGMLVYIESNRYLKERLSRRLYI